MRLEHRPTCWPVSSIVASHFKRALALVLVVVAIATGALFLFRSRTGTGSLSPVASDRPARGGSLTASIRSEPVGYNRFVEPSAAADALSLITNGRLVRVNRATDELEPGLAESWTTSDDGLTYTMKLREGIAFSDGTPFTSADVLFSARAVYDPTVNSPLAGALSVSQKPLVFEAPDDRTVVVRLPEPFTPGLRLLDSLPIFPRHKLETALNEKRFAKAWAAGTPPAELAGLGPFVLTEHVPGQRLVFSRNPHYWRRDAAGEQLPYLDRLTWQIVSDQNTESLRMESGDVDFMVNGDIRPEDFARFRRAQDQGRLRLLDVGIALDPNLLWFNLGDPSPKRELYRNRTFRQALSYAIDRNAIVNTVYLGAAVPIYGPVTEGNRHWYSNSAPTYPYDPARARDMLASLGLKDANGDGTLEQKDGTPVRFSVLTQRGHTVRERTVSMIQEHLRQVGIAVDAVTLDPASMFERFGKKDFDAIYYALQASATDPALSYDFWLSTGRLHLWNPGQPTPATDAERRIDELMHQQAAAKTQTERQRIFAEVQKIMGDEQFGIYLAAGRVTLAVSSKVRNPQPSLLIPQLLWSADTLAAGK
jgi:peptide/nickel transport system substrate-binding protein